MLRSRSGSGSVPLANGSGYRSETLFRSTERWSFDTVTFFSTVVSVSGLQDKDQLCKYVSTGWLLFPICSKIEFDIWTKMKRPVEACKHVCFLQIFLWSPEEFLFHLPEFSFPSHFRPLHKVFFMKKIKILVQCKHTRYRSNGAVHLIGIRCGMRCTVCTVHCTRIIMIWKGNVNQVQGRRPLFAPWGPSGLHDLKCLSHGIH